jgi:N-acetylglutamate synthase-like GNAT family acetyltransferase
MEKIAVSRIRSSSPQYPRVLALREEILRVPLGLSLKNEDLSRDLINDIFIAEHANAVIGCLQLQEVDKDSIQLRAMAVSNEWQGKGIGRLLVKAAEDFAIENKYEKVVLHARKVALGFYATLGYTIYGDEFIEVGIPHFIMEKTIL